MGAQWKAKPKEAAANAKGKIFGKLVKEIMVAARSGADPAGKFGLSSLTAAMLDEGAGTVVARVGLVLPDVAPGDHGRGVLDPVVVVDRAGIPVRVRPDVAAVAAAGRGRLEVAQDRRCAG